MVELASTGVAATMPPAGIRVLALAEPDSHLVMGWFCAAGPLTAPPLRAFLELFSPDRHVHSQVS
jgi:hypothetical protein